MCLEGSAACVVCGENVPKANDRGRPRKYCSDACRRAFALSKGEVERLIAHGTCLQCGGTTRIVVSTGMAKRFCSRSCSTKWKRRQNPWKCSVCGGSERTGSICANRDCQVALGYRKPLEPCIHCKRLFTRKNDRIGYCSVACASEAVRTKHGCKRRRGDNTPVGWCSECGKLIVGMPRRRQCFSCKQGVVRNRYREHARIKRREIHRETWVFQAAWCKCNECGKVWWAFERASRRKFCSERCSTRELKRSTNNHRKRARKWGVAYETIRLADLMARDSGRCVVCGVKVKRTKKHNKRRATLGHIVPVSKGGPHTWDNVQLECWQCNTSKGAVTHGQRRLWGERPPRGSVMLAT